MATQPYHTPVLLQEVLSYLLTTTHGVYVDGTLGGGGHARALLEQLDHDGKLIGIDLDDDAIEEARERLKRYQNNTIFVKNNFKNILSILTQCHIEKIHGVLLDLGISSFQLDEPTKGFSFRTDEQLDMRMNRHQQMDAKAVINEYDEQTLAQIFWNFGEEKSSKRIARNIVKQRLTQPIHTTGQFAAVIEETVGGRFLNKTLARVFQAVRIEVNNEMENLRQALQAYIGVLNSGGRIVVISYHSLEDRIVKETFREASAESIRSGHKLIPDTPVQPRLKMVTRKPITASQEELSENPRSRSAKLRAAEKV